MNQSLFMERSILVHRKMDAMKLPVRSLTSEEHYQLGGVNLTNNFIVRFTSSCSIVASLCKQSTLLPKLHQYKLEKGERSWGASTYSTSIVANSFANHPPSLLLDHNKIYHCLLLERAQQAKNIVLERDMIVSCFGCSKKLTHRNKELNKTRAMDNDFAWSSEARLREILAASLRIRSTPVLDNTDTSVRSKDY